MGSLEKLLELKHSRWSLLWFCCPFPEPSLSSLWKATHRLRLNGTGLFKLTRLSLLPTKPNLLEERRGPPTLLQTSPFPEHLLLLLSPLSRLLSGTMLSSSRLKMKLLLLENEKLSTLE